VVFGCFDLDVAAGAEIDILPFGQFEDQRLDEGRDVFVGANRALPLLDAEDLFGNFDIHILLDRNLTRKAVPTGCFAFGDVAFFGRQDRTAAGVNFHPALGTGPPAAAG